MAQPKKRDAERMRDVGRKEPRDGAAEKVTPDSLSFLAEPVIAPTENPNWHPIARAWYASLAKSGQSLFYEPSDWAMAMLIAESISRDLGPVYSRTVKEWVKGGRDEKTGEYLDGHYEERAVYETQTIKSASLGAYLTASSKLLADEFTRRTLRIEVERGEAHEQAHLASVTDIASTRAELLGEEEGAS